jgi:hypothetical protein
MVRQRPSYWLPYWIERLQDLLQLVEQIKFGRKIFDQGSIRKLLTGNELTPGPDVQTDEEIAGLSPARRKIGSVSQFHQIS